MKISVVTPCLNQARLLPATLASVRDSAQRAAPPHEVEHIVVDGGSTDGSLEVLRGQRFARWSSGRDAGQSAAVNRGWRESSGEALCFLCADDLWLPETARVVCEAFAKEPSADVVFGDYYFLEGETGWMRPRSAGEFSLERLRRHNFLSQPATFLRRGVFERHGGLREDLHFCMDHEYWLRIAADTRWARCPFPLAAMRLHADAKTSSRLAQAWWETARMARAYGEGRRFFWKAVWMQVAGQYLYRLRRRVYRAAGAKLAGKGARK